MRPLLSILIPTTTGRESYIQILMFNIAMQMKKYGLKSGDDVEVVISKDSGQFSLAKKMNALLQSCKGMWACFLNDGDTIADDYIATAIHRIKKHNPDCINLIGSRSVDGTNPTPFKNSKDYKEICFNDGIFCQPPTHINVIRTDISQQFLFPESPQPEMQWSAQIAKSGLLKTEARIDKESYYVQFVTKQQPK